MAFKIARIFICLILFPLLLLLTNTKVLFWEKKILPGQTYHLEDHGNLGDSTQSTLVGFYFTGRKIIHRVYWYSPNNIFGRDSCPFLLFGND